MIFEDFEFRQLNLIQIFQIYIVQGLIVVFFAIMANKILKRGKARINILLSGYYICGCLGFIVNFVFPVIRIDIVMSTGYFLTLFFLYLGQMFLTVFTFVLKESAIKFNTKKQMAVLISYAILISCMQLIPNGLTITEATDWSPVYSDTYFIYLMILLSIALLPLLYNSIHIYGRLNVEELKRKWKFFVIGVILLYLFGYGTLTTYKITLGEIVLIWGVIAITLIITAAYFIYHGVAQTL